MHPRIYRLFSFVAFNVVFFALFLNMVYKRSAGQATEARIKREALTAGEIKRSSLQTASSGKGAGRGVLVKLSFN